MAGLPKAGPSESNEVAKRIRNFNSQYPLVLPMGVLLFHLFSKVNIEIMVKKSRGWCFTVNNYTDEDIAYLMALYEEDPSLKYLVIGFEKGEKCGTDHIQGYMYFNNPISFKSATRLLKIDGRQHHVEAQKAALNVQAYCYCFEDRNYYEMGEVPRQGHRTDLEVIRHRILDGRPLEWVADNYFSQWLFHRRGFQEYLDMKSNHDTLLIWYDQSQPMKAIRYIKNTYSKFKYHIVTETVPYTEICKLVVSSRYHFIFVPNSPMYQEYQDDFHHMLEDELVAEQAEKDL